MAHTCPDCDATCYCGGDIDVIVFDNPKKQAMCTCCPLDGDDPDDDDLDDYDEED